MSSRALYLAEVFRVQFKNNWVREAVYRTNFLTALATDIIWIIIEFSLFGVIYANVSTLPGWTRDQVYFFLGMFFASDALFTTFFQRNFWNFSDLVNKGELDILLTKPISPVFLALSRWMNLTAGFNIFLGLGIMIRFAGPAGFEGGWKWLLVLFWLFVGVTTALLVRFAFSIWVFWTERSWALARLYYQFFTFATKPDGIYPRFIRYLILTALPFAFIGSVPARALLHGLSNQEYALVVGVLFVFAVADIVLWRKGLKRYQSASSQLVLSLFLVPRSRATVAMATASPSPQGRRKIRETTLSLGCVWEPRYENRTMATNFSHPDHPTQILLPVWGATATDSYKSIHTGRHGDRFPNSPSDSQTSNPQNFPKTGWSHNRRQDSRGRRGDRCGITQKIRQKFRIELALLSRRHRILASDLPLMDPGRAMQWLHFEKCFSLPLNSRTSPRSIGTRLRDLKQKASSKLRSGKWAMSIAR